MHYSPEILMLYIAVFLVMVIAIYSAAISAISEPFYALIVIGLIAALIKIIEYLPVGVF